MLFRPLIKAGLPKVSTWTDWIVSQPTRANTTPNSAEIHPRTTSVPMREPQIINPNRQKRNTSQLPNFRAMVATKGWMKNTITMEAMQAKIEE